MGKVAERIVFSFAQQKKKQGVEQPHFKINAIYESRNYF